MFLKGTPSYGQCYGQKKHNCCFRLSKKQKLFHTQRLQNVMHVRCVYYEIIAGLFFFSNREYDPWYWRIIEQSLKSLLPIL